jgi:hypothetical protein
LVDSAAKSLLQVKAGNLKVYAVTDKPRLAVATSMPRLWRACRQYVRQRLFELGGEIPTREQQTPEALAAHHKAETERWWAHH